MKQQEIIDMITNGENSSVEFKPVSGTSLKYLDRARLENYLRDILGEPDMPESDAMWVERLMGLGFLTTDSLGRTVCTIAGLALFGIRPRKYLPQSGLRWTSKSHDMLIVSKSSAPVPSPIR